MSISSLAKVANVLGATKEQSGRGDDPDAKILKALLNGKVLVSGLTAHTGLPATTVLEVVERLRKLRMVEIVEAADESKSWFIQLTPEGYASFAA